MAWKRLCYGMRDMPFNYSKFICDEISDIETLPTNKSGASFGSDRATCAIGSRATVISERTEYILNNANRWVSIAGGNSEDGAGSAYIGGYIEDADGEGLLIITEK